MISQSSSELSVMSPHNFLSSFSFLLQNIKYLVVRKPNEGDAPTCPSGKLTGDALLVGAELRAYGIKQINRTADDVFHLFRAVITLGVNHKADSAVQAHF